MPAETYIQINLLPVLMLVILLVNARAKLPYSRNNRLFVLTAILTIAVLTVDTASWLLDGRGGDVARVLLWILNFLYFALTEAIAYCWFVFVYGILYESNFSSKKGKLCLLAGIPALLTIVLLAFSPWMDGVFTLDQGNRYRHGSLFPVQYIVGFGYMIAATVMSIFHRGREQGTEKRREYLYLASFVVLPILGGTLQIFNYGLALLWPFTATSELLVYFNLQHNQLSLDFLTGLNNRDSFHLYLASKCARSREGKPWFLIILDIDDFKRINDRYGHTVGDEALRNMAGILKKQFGLRGTAFLARFGGDEFAVVLDCDSRQTVENSIAQLDAALEKSQLRYGYGFTVSAGFACYDSRQITGMDQLIAQADLDMYDRKNARKAAGKE